MSVNRREALEVVNSLLLACYMQAILAYYVFSSLRLIVFALLFVIIAVCIFYVKKIVVNRNFVFLYASYCTLSLIIQSINHGLSHFTLLLILGPLFAYWVKISNFRIAILKYSLLVYAAYFSLFFFSHGFLSGVFADLSENYVSVMMISHVIIIAAIQIKQNEQLSLWPSFLALLVSLMAMGRSGILCSAIIFTVVAFMQFVKFSKVKRLIVLMTICLICLLGVKKLSERVTYMANGIEVLWKFQERGLKSPSRGILIDEYFNHIDAKTLLIGYDFEGNHWFQHYGNNPHNSYIRLHHEIGIVSIFLLLFILYYLFNAFWQNKVIFFMLFALILRALTDTFLFYGFYDFIPFFLIMLLKRKDSKKNIQ